METTWKQVVYDVANAIREKLGNTDKIPVGELANKIKVLGGNYPNGKSWEVTETISSAKCITNIDGTWYAGTNSGIRTSVDGKTWTKNNVVNTSKIIKTIKHVNDITVIGVYSYGLYYSTDKCKTWTQSNITSATIETINYSNGLWTAGSDKGIYYSIDGKTWTLGLSLSRSVYSINYVNNLWVAGTYGIYYSTNGKNWTSASIPTKYYPTIVYNNGIWVAASGNNTGLYYSIDGKTWTQSNITSEGMEQGADLNIYYENGMWIACLKTKSYYSKDGKIWTEISDLRDNKFKQVIYKNDIWLAGGKYNGGIYYSINGINWFFSEGAKENSGYIFSYKNGSWIALSTNEKGNLYSEGKQKETEIQ